MTLFVSVLLKKKFQQLKEKFQQLKKKFQQLKKKLRLKKKFQHLKKKFQRLKSTKRRLTTKKLKKKVTKVLGGCVVGILHVFTGNTLAVVAILAITNMLSGIVMQRAVGVGVLRLPQGRVQCYSECMQL